VDPDLESPGKVCVVAAAPSMSGPLRAGAELAGAFARLGIRVIQPTCNYRCAAGDGWRMLDHGK
jgi:hypothetical protein